ncbi:hypothetical protein TAMA11512_21430 [Selenomonas sp. TAMA-11512]|uniref:Bbp19 family protein n=2 Tax=Selenomonas sp. TAMA-11512 TaxID=3095337 RepID=UPI0030863212|nr:hypothetical protein TAMA11512_21430 [Selenomonas sp. TAMA-11512]
MFSMGAMWDGHAKEQEALNELERQRRERVVNDLKLLLEHPVFRRYVWRVLSFCKVMDKSMDANSMIMAFREGQRDIGIRIMQDIMEAKPEAYELMRAEHTKAAQEEAAQLEKMKEEIENG